MNNDLISREALKNDLITFFPDRCLEGITTKTLFKQILTDIDNAPTVDLSAKWAEAHSTGYDVGYTKGLEDARPKGEWVNTRPPEMSENCVCNQCWHDSLGDFNFCPNCGADMRKGAE